MFLKVLKTEFRRAFRCSKIFSHAALMMLLMLLTDWNQISSIIANGYIETVGSIGMLSHLFYMAVFASAMVVILAGLHSNSFCKDDNSRYLRMILMRADVTTYTQCRFLANLCVVLVTSVLSMYLYVLVLRPFMPLLSVDGLNGYYYYSFLVENYPFFYVGFMGLILGLIAAACSSIGLLYSAYDTNSFVSIALSSLVFFVALSYMPAGTPLNLLNMVSMASSIGNDAPRILMFLWTCFYMLSIIAICGVLFYRRMKWRAENGYI